MALKSARCTNCGKRITVDDNQDAGICTHCTKAYVTEKAISKAKSVNNISKGSAIVIGVLFALFFLIGIIWSNENDKKPSWEFIGSSNCSYYTENGTFEGVDYNYVLEITGKIKIKNPQSNTAIFSGEIVNAVGTYMNVSFEIKVNGSGTYTYLGEFASVYNYEITSLKNFKIEYI